MNYKNRSLRAVIAVMSLVAVSLFSADMIGHSTSGTPYNYAVYALISLALLTLAVSLFAWNATQYAVKRRK